MSSLSSKCQSQNSAQACSISLSASETPDLRNWFPSYVYESPALTGELGDSVLQVGVEKKDKEGLSIGKSIDEEGNFNEGFIQVKKNAHVGLDDVISSYKRHVDNHGDVKISAASCSISLSCAETPDLGNWFSSYEYESPALIDDFILAGPRVGERKKEGSVLENTENEEENFSKTKEVNANANVCIDKAKSSDGKHDRFKGQTCSDSPFTHSEPPHISKWLSSYIYESPEFSIVDESRKSAFKENEQYSTDVVIGNKLEFVLHQSPSGSLNEEENLIINDSCETTDSSLIKLHLPQKYFRTIGEKVITDNDKGNDTSSLKENGYLELKQDRSSEVIPTSPKTIKNSWHANAASPLNSNSSVHISEHGSDLNSTNRVALESKLGFFWDLSCGNDKKGHVDKNGFVSVKKKGDSLRKDENSLQTQRILNRCSNDSKENVSTTTVKDGAKRNPLSDMTNFQGSTMIEIAGKWQCPQKGKPNLGPPMKQLRLEKWIHRA